MRDRLPPMETCLGSRVLFKSWEMTDNISQTVQVTVEEYVSVTCRLWRRPMPMTE